MLIHGEIIRIISFDGGYKIFKILDDSNEPQTLVGNYISLPEGTKISAEVEKVVHPKYGQQFKIISIEIDENSFNNEKNLIKYLSNSFFKDVGPKLAERIVKYFGLETIKILDNDPERIKEVDGIGEQRYSKIAQQWKDQRMAYRIFSKLLGWGIDISLANKIYQFYGNDTIEIIQLNPYVLVEIHGIGFHTADLIALKSGIATNDVLRIKSAIYFTLKNSFYISGHSYIDKYNVIKQTVELLNNDVGQYEVNDAFQQCADFVFVDGDRVYLKFAWQTELEIANLLKDISKQPKKLLYRNKEDVVKNVILPDNISLSVLQQEAIFNALQEKVSIITGSPGSGKTFITKIICDLLEKNKETYMLCSPTGRAARKLAEYTGKTAQTIHKLIMSYDGIYDIDYLIVDEMSMVDMVLFRELLSKISVYASIIMIGDINQLPPIGPGNVLKDIIKSQAFCTTSLNIIYRQKMGVNIPVIADQIIKGQLPSLPLPKNRSDGEHCLMVPVSDIEKLKQFLTIMITQHLDISKHDICVLSPMKKRELGTKNLNVLLQNVLNPKEDKKEIKVNNVIFRVGDKVINITNNYTKGLYNGDVGEIVDIIEESIDVHAGMEQANKCILVKYDSLPDVVKYCEDEINDLLHAYALTVHKSQGSEYDIVLLILHSSQSPMLQRNLLYTGITRAKKLCVIFGDKKALSLAIQNDKEQKRNTSLYEKIIESMNQAIL